MIEVTLLIGQAREGDRGAAERLFRAVYDDLHRIAARQVGRGAGGGLGSTSLVHETCLRLARPAALDAAEPRLAQLYDCSTRLGQHLAPFAIQSDAGEGDASRMGCRRSRLA